MGYLIAIGVILYTIGIGFLGYKYGNSVEDGIYADLKKAKDELAKIKAKV